jgi:hypothetical protein
LEGDNGVGQARQTVRAAGPGLGGSGISEMPMPMRGVWCFSVRASRPSLPARRFPAGTPAGWSGRLELEHSRSGRQHKRRTSCLASPSIPADTQKHGKTALEQISRHVSEVCSRCTFLVYACCIGGGNAHEQGMPWAAEHYGGRAGSAEIVSACKQH